MYWADALVENLSGKQIINDSKTPSGRVHVGSLRGVVVHDLAYRAALDRGFETVYYFGQDDFDPLDNIPPYLSQELFQPYLGQPLCNIPAPDISQQSYSDYFMQEFVTAFNELGCTPNVYRTSEIYKAGKFNEPIQIILEHADEIRRIYQEISGSEKNDTR